MPTVREYFDRDVKQLSVHCEWNLANVQGELIGALVVKKVLDLEANARYWYVFVPGLDDLHGCLAALFDFPDLDKCQLSPTGDGLEVQYGYFEYSEISSTSTLVFTRRVHLYLDADLNIDDRRRIVEYGQNKGYIVSVRDREYSRVKSSKEKPIAFISHDTRDKDSFVRELALELIKNYCMVWYDEFSLKVGDSLRANIERGLKETEKCIVVLSPNFLSNEGWGKAEFDSAYIREILEKTNVILPVWLGVEVKDVYAYSPRLADKVGLAASLGAAEVAKKLASVLRNNA